jgi:hypothetical protein
MVAREDVASPRTASEVEVAFVVVASVAVRFWRVDDARTMIPVPATFGWIHVEDVAQRESPPPPPVGHVVRQVSPVRQMVVAESAVVDAYGKVEAILVEVPTKYAAVGVLVET